MKKLIFTCLSISMAIFGSFQTFGQCTVYDRIEENFDGMTGQDPPECWEVLPSNNIFSFENNQASMYGTDRVLILPNTSNLKGTLSFKARHADGRTYNGLNVLVGVYSNQGFTQLGTMSYGATGWISMSFDFSSNSLTFGNIAIKTSSNSATTKLIIDDLVYQTLCESSDSAVAITKNATVQLDATGLVIVNPDIVNDGSRKSCHAPIVNLSLNQTLFTCDNLGENEVILTADDDNGHTDTAHAVIKVVPYVKVSNGFISTGIQLDSSGQKTLLPSEVIDMTASTDCDAITFEVSPNEYDCSLAGEWQYLDVWAIYGNDTVKTTRLTSVKDNIAPSIFTQDIDITIDSLTGLAIITPTMIDAGSMDACGIETFSLDQSVFTCENTGKQTVTLTVTDSSGNSSTAQAVVNVKSFVPSTALSIDETAFCFESEVTQLPTLSTATSFAGATYYLFDVADSLFVDTVEATGGALSLQSDSLTKNTSWTAYAEIVDHSKSLWLPGSNDHLKVNTPGGLNYATAYTFSAWVKAGWTNSTNAYEPIFYAGGTTGSDIEMYVSNTSSLLNVVHNRGNGGTNAWAQGGALPTDGEYFHLAVTFDGVTTKVYTNGTLIYAQNMAAPTKTASSEMTFGYLNNPSFPAPQYYFEGRLDDIRLYSVARTEAEINSDMNRCLTGEEDNLELYLPLDEATGSITFDLVSNTPAQIIPGGGLPAQLSDDNALKCGFTCTRWMEDTIALGDYTSPTAVASDLTVSLINEEVQVLASEVNNGSDDNCTNMEDLVITLSKESFTDQDLGPNVVTLYVEDSQGNIDSTTATITVEYAVGIASGTIESYNVYPNPSTGTVFIDAGENTLLGVRVFNSVGSLILDQEGSEKIDLPQEAGSYVMELKFNNGIARQVVVVN